MGAKPFPTPSTSSQRTSADTLSTLPHQPYYAAKLTWDGSSIPEGIPLDLSLPCERQLDAQLERVFCIRTWYGDGSEPDSAAADAGYKRLLDLVFRDRSNSPFMFKPHIFDDAAEFNFLDATARPGEVPPFLRKAFGHFPTTLDRGGGGGAKPSDGWSDPEDTEEDFRTVLVVSVANKEACEKGWLQILRINDKGESLPTKLRVKAAKADNECLCFVNLGVCPYEGGEDKDQEVYVGKGDGWSYDY